MIFLEGVEVFQSLVNFTWVLSNSSNLFKMSVSPGYVSTKRWFPISFIKQRQKNVTWLHSRILMSANQSVRYTVYEQNFINFMLHQEKGKREYKINIVACKWTLHIAVSSNILLPASVAGGSAQEGKPSTGEGPFSKHALFWGYIAC